MKKILTKLLIILGLATTLQAQINGGHNSFEFLRLPASARLTALGGYQIAVQDDDINFALSNPAALNPQMNHQISFSHDFMVSDISSGYVSFGQHLDKLGVTMHGGIQYMNNGDFTATDEIGNEMGSFKANEYAFTVGAGRQLYERVSVGANLRFITSQFESYNANGVAGDLAVMFHDTASQFNISLVIRNLGMQMKTFTGGSRESLPYESQLGLSKRLQHLPFRFSVIYRYLNRWNVLYDDPNQQEDTFFFGEQSTQNSHPKLDNFARHFVFNGEFLLGRLDNFRIRLGYNHLLRKETEVRNLRSLSGFTMGLGVKVKWFRIDFGRAIQHLGAGNSHFTISTNFSEFK
ncbi:MAG: type IX secretion system protein PorQ [Bacteroidetes bacterium]|nr:type IX secretion system protein PorQ [Bacteroidota bacterium]